MGAEGLGLADADYWNDPLSNPAIDAPPAQGEGEDEDEEEGKEVAASLVLGAPSHVALPARVTLPAVVRYKRSIRESLVTDFARLGVVSVVDVDRNDLYRGLFVDLSDRAEPTERAPDLSNVPDGTVSNAELTELRERLDLPWRPASYVVTVHLRDVVSNRVPVRVGAPPTAYRDAEVERFLAARRGQRHATTAWPPGDGQRATYTRLARSPAVPTDPGISLTADRVVVHDAHLRMSVFGSFRLPAMPEDRVPPGTYEGPDPAPTALIGIHLMAIGSDTASPLVLSLRAPSFDAYDAGADAPLVTGQFAVDFSALVRVPYESQTYFIYAFNRAVMGGPVPVGVVLPERLPPGAEL